MSTPSGSADASRADGRQPRRRRRRPLVAPTAAGAVAGVGVVVLVGQLAPEFAGPVLLALGCCPHPGVLLAAVVAFAAGACLLQRFSPLERVHGWYYPLYCTAVVACALAAAPDSGRGARCGPGRRSGGSGAGRDGGHVILARSTVFARPNWLARCLDPSRAGWTAAALAALIYGGAAIYLAPVFPGGDEPHYLVITQSLLKDGDLKIENNHQRQDYLRVLQGRPQTRTI